MLKGTQDKLCNNTEDCKLNVVEYARMNVIGSRTSFILASVHSSIH
jgi:hypothetical protein